MVVVVGGINTGEKVSVGGPDVVAVSTGVVMMDGVVITLADDSMEEDADDARNDCARDEPSVLTVVRGAVSVTVVLLVVVVVVVAWPVAVVAVYDLPRACILTAIPDGDVIIVSLLAADTLLSLCCRCINDGDTGNAMGMDAVAAGNAMTVAIVVGFDECAPSDRTPAPTPLPPPPSPPTKLRGTPVTCCCWSCCC